MHALVLACGNTGIDAALPLVAECSEAELCQLPATPGRADLDSLLDSLSGRHVVVIGTDADLAAVVLRLLRTERLAEVPVGFVPLVTDSGVARIRGLPTDPGRAFDLAMGGDPDRVPLLRDDAGGVLVGVGLVGPARGVAYCDDEVVLRGQASRIEVCAEAEGGGGLAVRVVRSGLLGRRVKSATGRAFQIGCLPTRVVRDGVPHDRPAQRWTWYRHTEDLRLVRGLV